MTVLQDWGMTLRNGNHSLINPLWSATVYLLVVNWIHRQIKPIKSFNRPFSKPKTVLTQHKANLPTLWFGKKAGKLKDWGTSSFLKMSPTYSSHIFIFKSCGRYEPPRSWSKQMTSNKRGAELKMSACPPAPSIQWLIPNIKQEMWGRGRGGYLMISMLKETVCDDLFVLISNLCNAPHCEHYF